MPAIFQTLIPTHAYDQVAIFDDDFIQLFPGARAIKAIVKEQSKVMEHPLEDGATITDHRVILPIEIELSFILKPEDYQDTYNQIKQYYLDATLLNVQTKSGVYQNQLIQAMPLFALTEFEYSAADPLQSSTVNRGAQQGTTVNTNTSYGAQLLDNIRGAA
jgi:hypothetical protein